MSTVDENIELLVRLIRLSAEMSLMKKAVFSKPASSDIKRSILTPRVISEAVCFQLETFYADNKARHKNFSFDNVNELLDIASGYAQINLITSVGECEYRLSRSKNSVLLGGARLERTLLAAGTGIDAVALPRIAPISNNKAKKYILNGDEMFLKLLEVSDNNGRVYDKKQAKFRQINRFLELIRDVEPHLPRGKLRICDLCCGKSYLSFAVYHYFAVIRGRDVDMTGVDLKSDVIAYCNSVAQRLGFDGLRFLCGDVSLYDSDEHVDMVISLHACDTATDVVIRKALEWQADVILSTPCCHHEMNRMINCESLSFITNHSMLRQKLCDAATDALRLKLMEANGYDVAALELIDPEETPKNIMLRGIRRKSFDRNSDEARRSFEEYVTAYKFLTGKSPINSEV